jgi:hypothetical protein
MIPVSSKGTKSVAINPEGMIHPLLIVALQNIFGAEPPVTGIRIYKDARISVNGGIQHIRAFAKYDKDGKFFDWVTINWGRNSLSETPAKLLLIYEDKDAEISVLVQACFWQNQEDMKESTDITARWRLEINNEVGGQRKRVIRSVKLKNITDVNYVMQPFDQGTSTFGLDDEELFVDNVFVDVLQPRYAWACHFLKKSGGM